jgi:hypothetical protein
MVPMMVVVRAAMCVVARVAVPTGAVAAPAHDDEVGLEAPEPLHSQLR